MRELICTVSGQSAETTKNHYIRISNDRKNYPGYGESDKLSHQGYGQKDLLESREGLSRSFNHVQVPKGGVQAEAGRTPGTRPAASSDGRDSRLTFPLKVKVLIGCVIAVFSGVVVMICLFIRSVMLLKEISLMSVLPWVVGVMATYALLLLLFVALMKIASDSDRRMAEMGGSR